MPGASQRSRCHGKILAGSCVVHSQEFQRKPAASRVRNRSMTVTVLFMIVREKQMHEFRIRRPFRPFDSHIVLFKNPKMIDREIKRMSLG